MLPEGFHLLLLGVDSLIMGRPAAGCAGLMLITGVLALWPVWAGSASCGAAVPLMCGLVGNWELLGPCWGSAERDAGCPRAVAPAVALPGLPWPIRDADCDAERPEKREAGAGPAIFVSFLLMLRWLRPWLIA